MVTGHVCSTMMWETAQTPLQGMPGLLVWCGDEGWVHSLAGGCTAFPWQPTGAQDWENQFWEPESVLIKAANFRI